MYLDIKSGNNLLEISGIASRVDRDSPRIYGLGPDAHVLNISCTTKLGDASNQRRSKNAAVLKKLSVERKVLQAERDVRQTEFNLLDDAARSLAQDKAASFDTLMDTFVARKRNAVATVIEMDEKIEELDEEIRLLNNSHRGETAAVVTATIIAKRECRTEFQLTYCKLVAQVGQSIGANATSQWSPVLPGSRSTTCTRAQSTGSHRRTSRSTITRTSPRTRAKTGTTRS